MRRLAFTLIAFATLIAIVASCNRQPPPETQRDLSVINIGYFGDLSGPTFNYGQSGRNGVLMAADEINQAGGINGRKIDLIVEDDQGSPELAATLANKLARQDKVVTLIAGGASGSSLAAGPIAQSARVPMISPSGTNPAVTQIGEYIFRVCFIDPFQGEVMARFASRTLSAKKAAILVDYNSPYSRGLTEFFEMSFTKLGGQVVSKQSYTQGDSDFKGQLSSIRSAAPDVIYLPGYYSEVAGIAKQARQLGLTQPLLGGDGWDAPELWPLAGDSINGSFISNHYSVEDPSPQVQKFVHDYKLRYGNLVPDAHAALAYDAMRFLADAIQRAGTAESAKLRDALAGTKDFPGVTGIISMDSQRNAVKPAAILKLENGSYVFQETIQPESPPPSPSPSASPSAKK
ncbi:MAG TPA: ABC transporter substrate-binding protein [Pyrinomonadaceae bacterium]|nr:ABC transporter substrate-binding protein [Pyrinomonadaceae bacterium]